MTEVDYSKLIPVEEMCGQDEEETELLGKLYDEAKKFIESFRWSGTIKRAYLGYGIGKIIGIFLFELSPAEPRVDPVLWVVVGDIPSAYIVTDNAPEASDALEAYIDHMRDWVDAAKAGKSVAKLIPVNVPPTKEWAAELESRLNYLESEFLADCRLGPRLPGDYEEDEDEGDDAPRE